jgi:alkylhydroperoxidase/carboxymuconolactone decarboxylase family protein YurZ
MPGVAGSGRSHLNRTLVPTRLGELAALEHTVCSHPGAAELPRAGLDAKTNALVQLAALLAVGSSGVAHGRFVRRALDSGASTGDVLGTMTTIAPILGLGRLVTATPKVALGLGYDVDAGLEGLFES